MAKTPKIRLNRLRWIAAPWRWLRRHPYAVALAVAAGMELLFIPLAGAFAATRGSRYDVQTTGTGAVPYHRVAIVFGAGVYKNGELTPYLRRRMDTAITLYKAKRTAKLLLSGDNSSTHYNEPRAMKAYALQLGVPAADITLDYAGLSTYDTCYRANAIFGLTDATLVTQGYHLPRAMRTCRALGVRNDGAIALHPEKDFTVAYVLRECVSVNKMLLQTRFKVPPVYLGKPEPIR